MAKIKNKKKSEVISKAKKQDVSSIQSIAVEGFKSFRTKQKIDLKPLTILAGANSSGKSSIMQPLMLMKQTLEASYDPGVFKLDGPNVDFSDQEQMYWKTATKSSKSFSISLSSNDFDFSIEYGKNESGNIGILKQKTTNIFSGQDFLFKPGFTHDDLAKIPFVIETSKGIQRIVPKGFLSNFSLNRYRCFFGYSIGNISVKANELPSDHPVSHQIMKTLHLPGLRGNPARMYPKTATGPMFPGVFPVYAASIIASWMEKSDARLDKLGKALRDLGLTWKVEANPVSGVGIELNVGRLQKPGKNGAKDLVNIADVGVGVSQVLPVVVALLTAEKGRIVYIEQPEIHLHPRAQVAMAKLLLDAAKRGVIVVAETHSQFLLLGVQEQIAAGKYNPDLVNLNWFQRKPNGESIVTPGNIDDRGVYGDWPEDFSNVKLQQETRFLNASMRFDS